MNDTHSEPTSSATPKWFVITCIVLLVWNLLGVMAFFAQINMPPEQLAELSLAEQELYNTIPIWANIAFGCAVFGGALGCLALAMKKSIALPVLVVSLIGVLVQMYHSFFIANSFEVYGPGSVIMPIMVVIIAGALVFLAKHAGAKGWTN